ncbi:MAG TPA: alanine--glyoxylate aminotransferase family protein [Armatimonadetes bacterium]|nr:alanine--glyoxylate aminotransferase family protein [Armatimonadota bacterium]
MELRQHLLIPGPTPVPERVIRAMARQMINHRGPQYERMLEEVTEGLKRALYTEEGEVFTFPASGTGAMEAAVQNFLSPGDKVLAVVTGLFGERFADIASAMGCEVRRLEFEWGRPADPEVVRGALSEGGFKAVLLVQNETSTGVVNPVREVCKLAREAGALCIVDAVSGFCAVPLYMDEWGVDVVVSASQKALMTPPGLSLLALLPRAREWEGRANCPRYYFDLRLARKYLQRWQNPYTPPIPQIFALHEALKMIFEEGLETIFKRHEMLGRAVREGVKAMGLKPLADDESYASPAVTAIVLPEGVDDTALRREMRERYGVVIAGGQGPLKGRVVRIGHVGYVLPSDIVLALSALGECLKAQGAKVDVGAAVEAAQSVLREAMPA